jgi:hypothetical protein
LGCAGDPDDRGNIPNSEIIRLEKGLSGFGVNLSHSFQYMNGRRKKGVNNPCIHHLLSLTDLDK